MSQPATKPTQDWVKAYTQLPDATGMLFSTAKYRELIRDREQNGLAAHTRVVGRDVLISVGGFWTWLDESHTGKVNRNLSRNGGRPRKR